MLSHGACLFSPGTQLPTYVKCDLPGRLIRDSVTWDCTGAWPQTHSLPVIHQNSRCPEGKQVGIWHKPYCMCRNVSHFYQVEKTSYQRRKCLPAELPDISHGPAMQADLEMSITPRSNRRCKIQWKMKHGFLRKLRNSICLGGGGQSVKLIKWTVFVMLLLVHSFKECVLSTCSVLGIM